MVWPTHDSIFHFLKNNLQEDGSLKESAYTLPDETERPDGITFAPGLWDAQFLPEETEVSAARTTRLANLLTQVAEHGDPSSQAAFFQEVNDSQDTIGLLDGVLLQLMERALPIEPYMYPYAYALATRSDARNPVKFGISMLGLCQKKEPIEVIKILGLHDEFTVFSTVALTFLLEDPVPDLWELAKKVKGWGRIQIVDRLAEMGLPDRVKDWLVLEGYKNNIMHEYLALTCAQHGSLHEKLKRDSISHALFVSAGELIEALMHEGPAQGMSGYYHALETMENYIKHAQDQDLDCGDFLVLHAIKDYLESPPEDNELAKKWDPNEVSNCLIDLDQLLHARNWSREVELALTSNDEARYWKGKRAAVKLGIDLWDTVWAKLNQNPVSDSAWQDVITHAPENEVDRIIQFAVQHLPLAELGLGPEDILGFGEGYSKHACLGAVLSFLENYPGKGEDLVLVGLDSPVTRVRNSAIRVLDQWKVENWSSEIADKIKRLGAIEPNEHTKDNISRLLAGRGLE